MDGPLPEGLSEAWEEFLLQKRTISDLFAHPLLFPLQRPREMIEMLHIAKEVEPRVLMDIGSDKGGGLWAWLKFLPTLQAVIACEIRGLPYAEQFEKAFSHIKFLWMPHSSYEPSSTWLVQELLRSYMLNCNGIDVLFIDGDKSWFHKDFKAYKPMMQVDGVVIMHDIQDPSPPCAFEMCRSQGKSSHIFINTEDYQSVSQREAKTEHESWLKIWKGTSCGLGVIHL